MILVQLTISATTYYISDEYCYLTHQYDRKIKSVDPPRYAIRSNAGGYVEVEYGSVTIDPSFFSSSWPPPKSIPMTVLITDSTEAAAVTIFEGTAHRGRIAWDGITYDMYGTEYDSVVSESTFLDDTLLNIFTTYCGASYLNLTLSHTYDRATSPAVYMHVDADTYVIDMLSALAESVNHLFYIKGSTLYLVDMLISNGSAIEPGGKFYPPEYIDPPAYKKYMTSAIKKYEVDGTYIYGNIETSNIAASIEHIYGRVGNNSGDDQANLIHEALIPYETGKTYMMKVKYRRVNGSGLLSAGFIGIASDRSTLVNINGAALYTAQHGFVISAGSSSSWTIKTGYASGWDTTGDNTEHSTVGDPAVMHTDVAYVRPWMNVGQTAETGIFDIDFVGVYEVDGSGNILQQLFFDDFCGGFSDKIGSVQASLNVEKWMVDYYIFFPDSADFSRDWVRFTGSGEREVITSVAASKTAVEGHLANRKSILESPRMTIKLDLTAANMPEPGQAIEWTDSIIPPNGASSISCAIKARNISFDLDDYKVIVEGEGSIT